MYIKAKIKQDDLNDKIERHSLRLCKVGEKYGWFHTWEHYRPVSPEFKPSVDGCYAELHMNYIGEIYGIVEFADGIIKRIEPCDISFCDSINKVLSYY